ncbi:alpha/beta fold hydrolase [Poseidonocella sp. HB161398]|uniref:alpha/beta fold hydrolase n=1 Tax=Poseidonocella sp. HB161398 TaxID=2320855 RepID=UPI001107C81A|nr:alpha/beta fold hydrolase [Poseidonocella sp. HB161398]
MSTDRFAEVNGLRICYRETGPAGAPALFLVVGLGMQLVEWPAAMVERLSRRFRVICMDNRDTGLSARTGQSYDRLPEGFRWISRHSVAAPYHIPDMARDLLGLADHLGIGRFAVAGFSMGGMIAQATAILAPGRVTALASLSSCAGEPVVAGTAENDEMIERFFLPAPSRAALLEAYCESSAFYSGGSAPADAPQTRAGAEALIARMEAGGGDQGGYLRQAFAITDTPAWEAELRQLDVPALVLHGTEDPCLPVACGQRAAELVPGAELRLHDGLGHWISEGIADDLCSWLETLPATAPVPA